MVDATDETAISNYEHLNIGMIDALLMYYLKLTKLNELDDLEWAELVQNLHWIRNEERKASEQ